MAQSRVWLALTVTLFLFVFCQDVSSFQSDRIKSADRKEEMKPFIPQLMVPLQEIALVNSTAESDNITGIITPLIRRKRFFHHLMVATQGIALATGVVTTSLQITDYAIGGHLYAWSIPESKRRIMAAQTYMEGKKDKIDNLRTSYRATYETYENSYIYYNQYQLSQDIAKDLVNHPAMVGMDRKLHKDNMRAHLLENGITINTPGTPDVTMMHVAKDVAGISIGVLGHIITGKSFFKTIRIHAMKMQDLNIIIKEVTVNGKATSVLSQANPKISSNPKYRASSIKNARAMPSFDNIDANGNVVGNKLITIMDENGVVQSYMTEEASAQMRSKFLKTQGIKEIGTTSIMSQALSRIKGFFNFKLSSKYLASKNAIKFDPNTGRNTDPLRTSKTATALAALSLGLQVAGLTMSILNQQKSAVELEEFALQIEANKKQVDHLLAALPKNTTAMETSIDEMVAIVGYLLESEDIKCKLSKDNLLPVLREIAKNGKEIMKNAVTYTTDYETVKFGITDNLHLGGRKVYEKMINRKPNMKSEIVTILRELGQADFEWTDWTPVPGQDGKCHPICGIEQRKIRRTCLRGDCFGTERAIEICDSKIFDEDAYEKCKKDSSVRSTEGLKGVGDFLPVVCKSHLGFKKHDYFILVNEDSGLALSIDKEDSRSLITTSKTGGDNQLWRLENGCLVCKYYGRTLGTGFEKWKYNDLNKRIIEEKVENEEKKKVETEKKVLGMFPCSNTGLQSQRAISDDYSEQAVNCQTWRMVKIKPAPATTTTPAPATTTSNPKTMEEFLNLIKLTSLLPKFEENGITLEELPYLLEADMRDKTFNDLGITKYSYKRKLISGANKYFL